MSEAVEQALGASLAGHCPVSAAKRPRGVTAPGRPLVLICEDDPLLAMELAAEVAEAGAACCGPAATCDEALALADHVRPTVALVDLNLADGPTGAGLAAELDRRGIRILVLSGDTGIHRRLGRTPHVFVPKPVPPAVLQDLLKSLLKSILTPLPGDPRGGTERLATR